MSGAPSSGPGAGHVGGLCLLGLIPSLTLFRHPEATFPPVSSERLVCAGCLSGCLRHFELGSCCRHSLAVPATPEQVAKAGTPRRPGARQPFPRGAGPRGALRFLALHTSPSSALCS